MDKSSLIYPMFVMEGSNIKQEIPTMPGQYRYSVDRLPEALEEVAEAGVPSVMLFGIPEHKDACGSGAWAEDGIVQKAFRKAKETVPELYLIGDVCMCEYTSHGHCGILDGEYVDNDKTLEYLAKIALSQVQAGADMVAPSDMMDGRVAAIRRMLDENGYWNRGREAFADLEGTVGLWQDYAATYNLGRYLTDYLNAPLVWDTEADAASWPEVEAMPAFPAAGSVALVDGTVVVKLS